MKRTIVWLIIMAAVLGPAIAIGLWWRNHYLGMARTCTVDTGDIVSGVIVSGSIRSRQRTAVAAEIIAAVQKLNFEEGQDVKAGQVLIEMDGGVVDGELAKANASVKIAEERLAELRAGARPEEIDRAQREVDRAESNLEFARKDYARLSKASAGGVATSTELDRASNTLHIAEADVGAAKASLALLRAGARKEEIAQAEAEITLAKAEVRRLRALLDQYTLKAPHAGIITVKYVQPGEVVSPGQVLLRLDSVKDLEVRAQVQESQLSGVRIGGEGRVLTDSYPDEPLKAVVEDILPRVDPETGAITVLLKLVNPPAIRMTASGPTTRATRPAGEPMQLMDNMAADIALIGKEVKGAVRVPAEAVEGRGKAASVWLRKGSTFVRTPVTVGVTDGHWVQIVSGLKPGQVVRLP